MAKILVIDDDDVVRSILSQALVRFGCQVIDASDGEEGINLLSNVEKYNLVITDICMPKKSGNDVATYIRRSSNMRDMLVVGITGTMDAADEELFDYLLPKPIRIKDLEQIVDRIH